VEFCEKLQELRKSRGLTQEELAEALYVSRTAVSKWESGRGYPSIDSLKEISNYFTITIDDLLSAEKLIFIAEKENKSNIRNICDLLFGAADLLSFLLIVLPLYPKTVDGYIYSVNLWMYTETAAYNRMVYWVLFLALMASGVIKILQTQLKTEKGQKTVTMCSVFLSIGTVLYLVLARETYAAAVAFLLMIMKGLLVFRHIKSD
jgi:transcriptional regulator with XRE-family HTH domain